MPPTPETRKPDLFDDAGACNKRFPVLDILERYDFGQFVNLFATGPDGVSRPVILARGGGIETGSGSVSKSKSQALVALSSKSVVDQLGGVPLIDLVRGTDVALYGRPEEARTYRVKSVNSVGATITADGTEYGLDLAEHERAALAMGNTVVLPVAPMNREREPILLRLEPDVTKHRIENLDHLLAKPSVRLDAKTRVNLDLEPDHVASLLAGRATTLTVAANGKSRIVRLEPPPHESAKTFADRPCVTRFGIHDLAAFLAAPIVPGIDGLPYRVPLTAPTVEALRKEGQATVETPGGTLDLVAVASSSQALMSTQPNGGGRDGDHSGGSGGGTSPSGGGTHGASPVGGGTLPSTTTSGGATTGSTPPTGTGTPPPGRPAADDRVEREPLQTAPRVAIFLPWEQQWLLTGFSRGHLIHTLALAPQEETTIELFTWERRKKGLEQTATTDTEQTAEQQVSTKDTTEVFQELTRQQEFQWQIGADVRATYTNGAVTVSGGGNVKLEDRQALNAVARQTSNQVHESTLKASLRVKTQRVTKITETVELGREERVTRKLRNPNLCYTLSFDYFEVLANYHIQTKFKESDARLVALVRNPLSLPRFDRGIVRRNETALRNALLDEALVDGLAACRLLAAYDRALEILRTQQDELLAKEASATANTVKAGAATPDPKDPVAVAGAAVLDLTKTVAARAKDVASAQIGPALDAIGADSGPSAVQATSGRRWLFRAMLDHYFPSLWSSLTKVASAPAIALDDARGVVIEYQKAVTGSPSPSSLGSATDADKENIALAVPIKKRMAFPWDWAWWSGRAREEHLYQPDDNGIVGLVDKLAEAYQSYLSAQQAAEAGLGGGDAGPKQQADEKQQGQSLSDRLEMKFPLETVAYAYEREQALLDHLADHFDYYRYAVFVALPPGEQVRRLTETSDGRLRVGMFEPRVVSMDGPYLAVPLRHELDPALKKYLDDLTVDLSQMGTLDDDVTLPTPGLSVDSRLGRCSACEEFVEKSRDIELRRSAALADQAEAEAKRYAARLDHDPPLLDAPFAAAEPLTVRVEQPPSPR